MRKELHNKHIRIGSNVIVTTVSRVSESNHNQTRIYPSRRERGDANAERIVWKHCFIWRHTRLKWQLDLKIVVAEINAWQRLSYALCLIFWNKADRLIMIHIVVVSLDNIIIKCFGMMKDSGRQPWWLPDMTVTVVVKGDCGSEAGKAQNTSEKRMTQRQKEKTGWIKEEKDGLVK